MNHLPTSGSYPTDVPVLERDEIHVWRIFLDLLPPRPQSLWQSLDEDERERANRFYFRKDRERFIVAHGALRVILSRYVGMKADQIRFLNNANGKPSLARQCSGAGLRFNLSHSQGLALIAVTLGREIGVDIERIRANLDYELIARTFFSQQGTAALETLPHSIRREAFFTCWTREEAYLKARGEGLSLVDQFHVTRASGERAAVLNTNWVRQEKGRWLLLALNPGPGYVAALAVEGNASFRISYWQWPGVVRNEQRVRCSPLGTSEPTRDGWVTSPFCWKGRSNGVG